MAYLSLSLLGTFQARLDEAPVTAFATDKVRALLAYLAVESGQPHHRETLGGLLWSERPERSARRNLSQTLFSLRQAIGDPDAEPPFFFITPQTLQFNRSSHHNLDVTDFTALLTACEQHPHRQLAACDACLDRLQQAVTLYRGIFLDGLSLGDSPAFEEWLLLERERYHRLLVETLHRLTDCYEQRGEYASGLQHARRWLELEPWQEEGHRQLMRLLALDGQRSAALTQYETCCRTLADDLGVTPESETTALYERICTGELSAAEEKQPGWRDSAIRHNLPAQPTPFVGRAEELAQLAHRLDDPACRLLTLVGPGGIGKTRLALQAVQNLIETPARRAAFPRGVYWVNLTPISSPDALVAAIAEALNFSFYSEVPPRQQLIEYLREKELLLGLDNFEHLLVPPGEGMKEEASAGAETGGAETGDAIDLVIDLLTAAPAVKILVTSREALNLQEEWLFPVEGLPFPQLPSSPPPLKGRVWEGVESYSAVQLFVQCARRVRPGFSLTAEQEDVVRICQLVEGMPLGIELAAAWLKMFSCQKIGRELERGLDLLTTSRRNMPARHRSMRAVFEHSWGLLSESERGVFRRLSVFRGGSRQEAAEQVAGATFSDLVALVEKSLLRLTPAGRYQVHELLRQFAAEKLQAVSEEKEAAQHRHSDYYLAFLQQREEALKGKQQQAALTEIGEEIENVRVAWNWAVAQDKVEAIDQALEGLYDFYNIRCRYQEGQEAFSRAAARLQAQTRPQSEIVLVKTSARQGAFCVSLSLYEAAEELLQKSLTMAQQLGSRSEMVFCLNFLGYVMLEQGDVTEAERLIQESLVINRELGDPAGIALSLLLLGEIADDRGEYLKAEQLFQDGLTTAREIGRQDRIAHFLEHLGWVTWVQGKNIESEQYYRESLALFKEIGDRIGMAQSLPGVPFAAWLQDQRDRTKAAEAQAAFQESLAIAREVGRLRRIAQYLAFLGWVAHNLGEYQEAQAYYQESLAISTESGFPRGLIGPLNGLGEVACSLGDFQKARSYLQQSLETAMSIQRFSYVSEALGVWAIVLAKEDALLEEDGPGNEEKKVKAVELLALVLHHPASWQVFKDRAAPLLAELEAELPPDVIAAALERGKARDLYATAKELLIEQEGLNDREGC